MLNEKAVKEFFLELYREEKNSQPEKSLEIFHAKEASGSRERCGVYFFYKHLWLEEENKSQNIVQKSGLFIINTIKTTLWTMSYDGWQERDESIISLQKQGLIKTFWEMGQRWEQMISLSDSGFKYENKTSGSFSLFDLEETTTNYFRCVSYHRYRGRALVDLPS